MAHTLRLRGASGTIRWSYLTAATVRAWTIAPVKPGSFALSATIVDANAYHLTQRPLTFVVQVQGGTWTWPIVSLAITGTTLRATLGPLGTPPETSTKGAHEHSHETAGHGQT